MDNTKELNNMADLCNGSVRKKLLKFTLPYLLACFMQTLYGMADLYVVGIYNESDTTTAVAIGSQITHMITVIIVGLTMGTTVILAQSKGANDGRKTANTIGSSLCFFTIFSIVLTVCLLLMTRQITGIMMTPEEAVDETLRYLRICFLGIPFIVAYNVMSGILRGLGDSKSPMYLVGTACVINIIFDFIFVGNCHMGAMGAALATILGQIISAICGVACLIKKDVFTELDYREIRMRKEVLSEVLRTGIPIACQDGFIQVSFILISAIANSRGLIDSAAVGIVEKIICFLFLVPSAFSSSLSAMVAQNTGAGKPDRARQALRIGLAITVCYGAVIAVINQLNPEFIVSFFTRDENVLTAGATYIRAYSLDVMFAAIHFCFSGYFCGIGRAEISFIHNIISIVLVRIPGAYFASTIWKNTLYPMGFAAPLGSLLSAVICIVIYVRKRVR